MVSGILVSTAIFPSFGGNAYEVGRYMHLIVTAWTFILMCVHLGLHFTMFVNMVKKIPIRGKMRRILKWICRLIVVALCAYGIYLFIERRFWEEMFLLIDYTKEYDYSKNTLFYFLESLALSALFISVTYYLKKLLLFFKSRSSLTGGKSE